VQFKGSHIHKYKQLNLHLNLTNCTHLIRIKFIQTFCDSLFCNKADVPGPFIPGNFARNSASCSFSTLRGIWSTSTYTNNLCLKCLSQSINISGTRIVFIAVFNHKTCTCFCQFGFSWFSCSKHSRTATMYSNQLWGFVQHQKIDRW